MSNCSSISMG